MSTVFTPLTVGFSWVNSTTASDGTALPTGETQVSTTIGVRADGDTTHSQGNYKWFVTNMGTATSISAADFLKMTKLAAGNYWAAIVQTDSLNGANATSSESPEIAFSVPVTVVAPAAPTNFTVA